MRRRSSLLVVRPAGARSPSGTPQPVQKAMSEASARPHSGQAMVSSAPQPPQNRSAAAA
jgi:hypothetical protein